MSYHDKRGDCVSRETGGHREHQRNRQHHDGGSRYRRRSRSPAHKRRRSESPREDGHKRRHDHSHGRHSSRRHRDRDLNTSAPLITLPFSARQLTKNDLSTFEPLLAEFLFIQKQKDLYEMEEREVKGRWKSFVGKWNRGELAEGWYDPETYARVKARAEELGLGVGWRGNEAEALTHDPAQNDEDQKSSRAPDKDEDGIEDEDDDGYGPVLPGSGAGRASGPAIPSREDLAVRDEQRLEDRHASITAIQQARKADRALQKERLDDLTPRAAAGTRERQLEQKQLLNEKLRSFRDRSPGGEVPDAEMMGGAGDELEELKREKERVQRKKSEREVRREEMERARREEIEERRRRWKEKEEGTVEGLRELVRQRFGG